jgi:tetratricopeptide (TPR) repeat protein
MVQVDKQLSHMNPNNRSLGWKLILQYGGLFVFSVAVAHIAVWAAVSFLGNRSVPPASALPSDDAANRQTILFLEEKTKTDPEDFIAQNKLAGYYLQQVRETGDLTYLKLAAHASEISVATLAPEHNLDGLAELAQVELTSHEFVTARNHALQLIELQPDKSYPRQMLGDALLELGEYDEAKKAYWRMEQFGGVQGLTRVAIEQRLARVALLRGDPRTATEHFRKALRIGLAVPAPQRETVAWCRWQLGETAFSTGDYPTAEKHYRDALVTFPNYFRALASLGRVRAACGDLRGAAEQYEKAISIFPDPSYVAALGDIYQLLGREQDAGAQYKLVEAIAHLNLVAGNLYNRQEALFYADHDIQLEKAYRNALQEYAIRKDIYGADAVAWTALKAGKLPEAQVAIKEALKLGTRDSKLFYHAGMIAQAAGDQASATSFLKQALDLSPEFDPLQARIARKALASLTEGSADAAN